MGRKVQLLLLLLLRGEKSTTIVRIFKESSLETECTITGKPLYPKKKFKFVKQLLISFIHRMQVIMIIS